MSEPRTAWHTERWFPSPGNDARSVRDQLHVPPNVQIHDSMLRDGEQQAGVGFTTNKIAIGQALLDQLTPPYRMVMARAGVSQPSNRPMTGSHVLNVESGIISTWVRNVRSVDLAESLPYLPAIVGQDEVQLGLGKGSGVDSIVDAHERIGLTATPEQVATPLAEVKPASLAGQRLLELDEFEGIARASHSGPASRSEKAGG